MRNVWNLGLGTEDTLVLLLPKENECLTEGVEVLKECLTEPYQKRVSVLYLEQMLATLQEAIPGDATRMKEKR